MKPGNIAALRAVPDVDGALVGGASLEVAGFAKIVTGASTGRDRPGSLRRRRRVYSGFAAPRGARQSHSMLYYLFVTLYVLACLVLMIVILLQQGKGGDIANAFGGGASQAVFGARAGATVLTKVTTGLTVAFMTLALLLAVWGSRGTSSVVGGVDGPPQPPAASRRADGSCARHPRRPRPRRLRRLRRASLRPLPPRRPPRLRPSRRRRRSSRHFPTRGSGRRRAQLNSETAVVAVFSPLNAEVAELADAPA